MPQDLAETDGSDGRLAPPHTRPRHPITATPWHITPRQRHLSAGDIVLFLNRVSEVRVLSGARQQALDLR